MAALATVATVATAAAAVIGAGATVYSGWQAQQRFEQQAKDAAHQAEVEGRAAFASSQRDALERRLEGKLILSQQQAAAAASGGGAGMNDPTIVRLMSETADRAEYGAQSVLFAGRQALATGRASARNLRASRSGSFVGSLIEGLGELTGGFADTVNTGHRFGLVT